MSGIVRQIIFFVLLAGFAFVGYHFMIKPANKDLAESKQRVEAKLAKLTEFEQATNAAEDLSKQIEQLHDAIQFFESKLPPTHEIHKVLEQVTVIAQREGLKPKTIRTQEKKNNSGYIEQPLRLELVGDFNAFYSFLLELEKLPRIMKVRKLDLKKSKDIDGAIVADCIVSIFFQNIMG
ncbi:type 4a pilus biogenesis protein PilO [Planctomycetota bacterium]